MTTQRQAMCRDRGHLWMPWGLWRAVMPSAELPMVAVADPVPVTVAVSKVRNRQCERCGAWQAQDGDGTITDLPE